MNILIIEDSPAKAEKIESFLKEIVQSHSGEARIIVADCLTAAVRDLAKHTFDLIILDLMLPYLKDGPASAQAGVEILKQIRHESGLSKSSAVIGLSAYPEEVDEFRGHFEKAGVLIVTYDENDGWKATLEQTLLAVFHRRAGKREIDFIILTALDEERAGYEGTDLVHVGESIVAGLNVRLVELQEEGKRYRGALIKLRQMGLSGAILDATLALSAFDVPIICMSGICAGFSKRTTLGQLIFASPAWEYQAGKWSANGFEIAPTQIPLPSATRVILDQVIESNCFYDAMDARIDRNVAKPSRWTKPSLSPAATGSAVIADASRLEHIEQQHRKVAALDMESFGVYYAAHEAESNVRHFFSAKCVVDLADADKDDELHEYGCLASARATIFVLKRLLIDIQSSG